MKYLLPEKRLSLEINEETVCLVISNSELQGKNKSNDVDKDHMKTWLNFTDET